MSVDASVEIALEALGELGQADAPIGQLTTYRVGGSAAVLAEPRSVDDLVRVGDAVVRSRLPVIVLGRGSNTLVADSGVDAIVVSTMRLPDTIEIHDSVSQVVAAGGVSLPVLARRTAAAGLAGFEWAVGVPGSVGGAVCMNAGGHGSDMAACLVEAEIVDLSGARPGPEAVPVARLGLGFRSSALRSTDIVVSARIQLARGDRERSEQEIADVVAWRRANQPGGQNAGSVFVNPVPGEISAGALIDGLGLRGRRIGTAYVSEKHANFIQADDGGSADDVYALMCHVRDLVESNAGFRLRTEIRLIGFGALS